ncbi:MAG: nucleotidyltransferase family protein [Candidatus Binatia bacterium]
MDDVKALILCGGKGTRLRPLTESMPKALVPLAGKPCLEHIFESHRRRGQRRFILCVGYRGDMIVDFVRRAGLQSMVEISDAGENASMLQRLHHARGLMGERVSVTYGDTLIDVDFARMLAEHLESGAAITLTTAEVRSPFGLLTIDGAGFVSSYREKPVHPFYVGHMILERTVLDAAGEDLLGQPDGGGLVQLFQRLVGEGRVKAFPYRGPQVTFNTQRDLEHAERELGLFFTQTDGGEE